MSKYETGFLVLLPKDSGQAEAFSQLPKELMSQLERKATGDDIYRMCADVIGSLEAIKVATSLTPKVTGLLLNLLGGKDAEKADEVRKEGIKDN